ncbi:hypothetical protein [Candidatus Electronema sp. PJ]|uniref:hypothetical protein n=1 Tax=Candidatus Electronema sp. PJ TaxID=3401572 RepID=UPI003AA7D0A5
MNPKKLKVLSLVLASLLFISCDKPEKPAEKKIELPKPASMLTLVPDDTIFFAGGLEPVPLKEWTQWSITHFNLSKEMFNPQEIQKLREEAKTDGQRLALQIWEDYLATLLALDTQFASWGFAEKPQLASYAIGLAPVLLRINLQDVQRFNTKIAELEEKAKVKAKVETLGTATFRRYALNEQEPLAHLIIGVDGNDAVFMIDVGIESQQTLALALGQSKPEKSLAQGNRLKSLQENYKLLASSLVYLDHQQILTGLTTKDGNRMAKMVQQLASKLKEENKGWLNELHSEGCRKDLQTMGANWPQTVFGYTAFDVKAKPSKVDALMVVESKDKPLLEGLKSLRGFVPYYSKEAVFAPAVFSFGLGLSVENVGPFLMKQWTEITQKQYSCSFLKEMQTDLQAKNPAAVGFATSMASGVRGLSLSLLSLSLEKKEGMATPMPKELEAVVSLSAKDPAALVQTVAAMVPQLATLQIPADGTPVQLPLPMPLPFTPMAAINGSHLTVYAGAKAEQLAKEMGKMSLESSQGFLASSLDYGKYYGLIGDVVASVDKKEGQQQATPQMLSMFEAMKQAKVRVQTKLDFTERGLEMTMDMTSPE